MSLRAIVLMNNRKAKIMETKPKHTHVKWGGGLYVVDPVAIAPIDEDGKVGGSEIIWFEGNPNPVGPDGIKDKSGDFLDEVLIQNTLGQLALGPRINIGELKELFSFLGQPVNWVYMMLAGAIIYGLIAGLMSGGIV